MSEQFLRIPVSPLLTIRVHGKQDGVVRELPIRELSRFADRAFQSRDIVAKTRESLTKLSEAISDLCSDECEVDIEFSVSVDP